jgi:hypothetical protein
MSKPCAFCRRTDEKITNEHVFPNWISRLFGHDPTGTAELVVGGSVKSFPAVVFQQKVRVVCKPCNEGWMNDLEKQVKVIMGPMMLDGQATELTPAVQGHLATWAVKTAMMMDYLHPSDRVIPEAQYDDFYRLRKPLPGHIVWIAHRAKLEDETGRELMGSVLKQSLGEFRIDPTVQHDVPKWQEEGRNVYRVTFTIGHVVFQVFGHNLPLGFQVALPPTYVVHCLWPDGQRMSWPASESVEEIGGFHALHKAFGD